MKRRDFLLSAGGFAAMSCTKPEYPRASKAQADAAFYHAGPPYLIALESMVNTNSNSSEHTGLLINGSQRVLYDPAGSYFVRNRPRRNDIHYGMTDQYVAQYESFHARLGYYVVRQTKLVTREVADLAIRRSEAEGETYEVLCAVAISKVLQGVPGFESVRTTFFPDSLRRQYGRLEGVKEDYIYEEDQGQNLVNLDVPGFDPNDTAPPPKPNFGRGEG